MKESSTILKEETKFILAGETSTIFLKFKILQLSHSIQVYMLSYAAVSLYCNSVLSPHNTSIQHPASLQVIGEH